MEYIKGLHRDL